MNSTTRTMILAALPKAPEGKEWKQYAPNEVMGEGRFISLSVDGKRIVMNQPNSGVIGQTVSSYLAPYQSSWHLVDVVRKVSPKPANHIVPKGYVYLGKGGEFKVGPEETMFGYVLWEHDRFDGSRSCSPSNWIAQSVPDNLYYYAPVASPLARLNGLGPKVEKSTIPAGVPPLPEGYVYLGKGKTFKKDKDFVGAYWESGCSDWKKDTGFAGCILNFHYAAPADSDIAKLNGLTLKAKKTTLRDENARLTKEVAALKEELAKAKTDIARLNSRDRDTRELATKIISRLS